MNLVRAFRRLRATPSFTAAALLTVGLGVGANTLVFSAVRGLLLEPLPFPEGDRLVWILGQNKGAAAAGEEVSFDEANALARAAAFEAVAAIGATRYVREEGARRAEWRGLRVTTSLAPLLGVAPVRGELLSTRHIGMEPAAAMLGYERWQRDFGGDPSIVGGILEFGDNKALTIVGILSPGLEFPIGRAPASGTGTAYAIGGQDFWVLAQGRADEMLDGAMVGRLARGDRKSVV